VKCQSISNPIMCKTSMLLVRPVVGHALINAAQVWSGLVMSWQLCHRSGGSGILWGRRLTRYLGRRRERSVSSPTRSSCRPSIPTYTRGDLSRTEWRRVDLNQSTLKQFAMECCSVVHAGPAQCLSVTWTRVYVH